MTKAMFSLSHHEIERFLYLTMRPRDNLVVGWGEGGAVEFWSFCEWYYEQYIRPEQNHCISAKRPWDQEIISWWGGEEEVFLIYFTISITWQNKCSPCLTMRQRDILFSPWDRGIFCITVRQRDSFVSPWDQETISWWGGGGGCSWILILLWMILWTIHKTKAKLLYISQETTRPRDYLVVGWGRGGWLSL